MVGEGVAIVEPSVTVVDSEEEQVRKGTWTSVSDADAIGGTVLRCNVSGSYLEFDFRGYSIFVRFRFGTDAGKAVIRIDREEKATIDLYNDTTIYKFVNVGVGLDKNVKHTLQINVDTAKNASATDFYVSVDAFVYSVSEQSLSLQSIEYIDLINVINQINKINKILLISSIASIGFISQISDIAGISEIGTIGKINQISDVLGISDIGTIGKINEISDIAGISTIGEIAEINPSAAFSYVESLHLLGAADVRQIWHHTDGYIYAATRTIPSKVVKIDAQTFAVVDEIILNAGEDYAECITGYGDYIYVGCYVSPAKIVKIDINTFTRTAVKTLAENRAWCMIVDNGTSLFIGTDTIPGNVVKLNIADFNTTATCTLPAGENKVNGLSWGDNAYNDIFASVTGVGDDVVEIATATMTRTTGAEGIGSASAGIDTDETYLYVAESTEYLQRYSMSPLAYVDRLDLGVGFDAEGIKVVSDYVYAAIDVGITPSKIVKVDRSFFTVSDTLTLPSAEESDAQNMVVGSLNKYLYVCHYKDTSIITKIDLQGHDVIINRIGEIGGIGQIGAVAKILKLSSIAELSDVTGVSTIGKVNQISDVAGISTIGKINQISDIAGISNIGGLSTIAMLSVTAASNLAVSLEETAIVQPVDVQGQYRKLHFSFVSDLNNNAKTGSSEDILERFSRITGIAFLSDAEGYLRVQQSVDDSHWDLISDIPLASGVGKDFSVELVARYVRCIVSSNDNSDECRVMAWLRVMP